MHWWPLQQVRWLSAHARCPFGRNQLIRLVVTNNLVHSGTSIGLLRSVGGGPFVGRRKCGDDHWTASRPVAVSLCTHVCDLCGFLVVELTI